MNFCPNCGSKLEGNPAFCPNCGQRLQGLSAEVQEARATRREHREITRIKEEMKDAKENHYGWEITSGIGLAVGIAGVIVWFNKLEMRDMSWWLPVSAALILMSLVFFGLSIYYWQKYKHYRNQL